MPSEKLFFKEVKEDRGWYFVEYKPPIPLYRFATLNVVLPEPAGTDKIVLAMETEAEKWLERYPIPLMVSAFDETGTLCTLTGSRPSNHLIAYKLPEGTTKALWQMIDMNELPADALDAGYLRRTYSDIPYRTTAEIADGIRRDAKAHRLLKGMLFFWLVIIPVTIATIEWKAPAWLAALVYTYSLGKAAIAGLKLLGKWKKSPRELEKEEEERLMRHHHYHCMKNSEAFLRLKADNVERELRNEIKTEALSLKRQR